MFVITYHLDGAQLEVVSLDVCPSGLALLLEPFDH